VSRLHDGNEILQNLATLFISPVMKDGMHVVCTSTCIKKL
jgi:hypothetical protein